MASVGPVNKRDIMTAEAAHDPLHQIILGFSTKPNTEVASRLSGPDADVKFISDEIIYRILEEFEEWSEQTAKEIDEAMRENLVYPGKIRYLENHTFRNRSPAIFGARILGGRVHVGQRLMKMDGTPIGQVKSLRSRDSQELKEAKQGEEVAMAVMGPTIGRQIEEGDEFYVDIPESHAKRLKKIELTGMEQDILEAITTLHRKENHFWGR